MLAIRCTYGKPLQSTQTFAAVAEAQIALKKRKKRLPKTGIVRRKDLTLAVQFAKAKCNLTSKLPFDKTSELIPYHVGKTETMKGKKPLIQPKRAFSV